MRKFLIVMEILSTNDQKLKDEAEDYIRIHKSEIIEHFAGLNFPADDRPVSFFMAGSPGAGKTEFSKRLIGLLKSESGFSNIVRIDADEIRDQFDGYNGSNAYIFQEPAVKMVHKIHDHVLKKGKSFILDGTFANKKISFDNIERSIRKGRKVILIYLYQDPVKAWIFTKKRELQEGRRVRKEDFIRQFFGSRENIENAIKLFGSKISVWLVVKDYDNPSKLTLKLNVDNVADHIKKVYTTDELEQIL